MTNIERFRVIVDEMAKLYERKNHDYGNSFDQSCDKHGLIAAIVRMEDKLNRASNLVENDAMVCESIKDTLTDLANYAIMARMWLEGKEGVTKPCDESQGTVAEKSQGTGANNDNDNRHNDGKKETETRG